MSREGWIVTVFACLLLLIVPYAMCSGLNPDTTPQTLRQKPRDRDEAPFFDEEAQPEEPEEPQSDEPPEVEEPAAARRTLTGLVTDASGAPVAGALVIVVAMVDWSVETDAAGGFEIAGLPLAGVVLDVEAFGYAETRVDVTDGAVEQDVVLAPSDDVTGTVLDPDGNPVAHATVKCAKSSQSVQADDDGRFKLPKTRAGCDGVASHASWADSARVELKLGPNNFLALKPLASIKGFVVDPDGAPHRGFVLSIHRFTPADGTASMRPYRQTFAHPQGRFQVTQLHAGTYVFTVSLRGRRGVQTQPIQVTAGQQLTGVKVVVSKQ